MHMQMSVRHNGSLMIAIFAGKDLALPMQAVSLHVLRKGFAMHPLAQQCQWHLTWYRKVRACGSGWKPSARVVRKFGIGDKFQETAATKFVTNLQ